MKKHDKDNKTFFDPFRLLNNIGISKRIFVMFLIVIIIFSILVITGINITGKTYDDISTYTEFNHSVTKTAVELLASLNTIDIMANRMINSQDTREILDIYIQIGELEKIVLADLFLLENSFTGDQAKIGTLRESFKTLQTLYNSMEVELISGRSTKMSELVEQSHFTLNIVNLQIQEVLLIMDRMDYEIINEAENNYVKQRRFLLYSGAIAALLLSIFVYFLGKGIYYPLERFAEEISKSKDISYNAVLDTARKDEIGYISNEFVHMLSSIKNSNRKILELEAIARNNQKMESLGVMASGIAHEINNPINGILGYSELLMDMSEKESEQYTYSSEIAREVTRVSDIVKNLLHFSRHKYSRYSKQNLKEIIEKGLSLVKFLVRKDNISIVTRFNNPDLFIVCSEQEIQQVLINLVMNSRYALNKKFPDRTDVKEIRITTTEFEKKGEQWVRLSVYDNGTGIPVKHRESLFDPFFTIKPKDEGTGLGLSISYGIVKKHNGEIYFNTEENEFTEFIIELPEENKPGGEYEE